MSISVPKLFFKNYLQAFLLYKLNFFNVCQDLQRMDWMDWTWFQIRMWSMWPLTTLRSFQVRSTAVFDKLIWHILPFISLNTEIRWLNGCSVDQFQWFPLFVWTVLMTSELHVCTSAQNANQQNQCVHMHYSCLQMAVCTQTVLSARV